MLFGISNHDKSEYYCSVGCYFKNTGMKLCEDCASEVDPNALPQMFAHSASGLDILAANAIAAKHMSESEVKAFNKSAALSGIRLSRRSPRCPQCHSASVKAWKWFGPIPLRPLGKYKVLCILNKCFIGWKLRAQ
jgi:hypothetical protein